MRSMRSNRLLTCAVPLLLLFSAGACEPPGKPKPEPPSSQDIVDFNVLYSENCAGCHGANGRNGPARPLNNALYLSVIPRDTLGSVIANGRPGTAMPAWARSQGGPLTDKQIAALADGMERNWAKPDSFQNLKLPSYSASVESGDANRGKKSFVRDCYVCHGQPAIGSVTDPAFLELVSDQMLRTSIIEGRPDLGMPDYRNLNAGHALSDQDISDLVAYLVSMRPSEANAQNAHLIERGGK